MVTCKTCERTFGTYEKYEQHFEDSWKCEHGSPLSGVSNTGSSYLRD